MAETFPVFATNPPLSVTSVGDEVNRLFRVARQNFQTPLAIATAYLNPGGFAILADELEAAPGVRLLLGADPEPSPQQVLEPPEEVRKRLTEALASHDRWMEFERNHLGFEVGVTKAAKRLVAWLRSMNDLGEPRVEVRRYKDGFLHGKTYIANHPVVPAFIAGSSNFTYAGLTANAELNVGAHGTDGSAPNVVEWFEDVWAGSESYDLAAMYEHLWADHAPWTIWLRMLDELYGGELADEEPGQTRFGLTRFQADGVKRMERLLDELGGVLVADEVGLGKTYLAAEVIAAATEQRRQKVIIAAPAALKTSVWEPFMTANGMNRLVTVHSYEEIRNWMDPQHPKHEEFRLDAEEASLIVVDEAHNLRNAAAERSSALDRVILAGKYPKKVVLLTATPVNNSLIDLETLLKYFIRDDARFAHVGIPSIRQYIRHAQSLDPDALTPAHLFDLMNEVSVRRTRKFIKENYSGETITGPGGKQVPIEFPDPNVYRIDYTLDAAGADLVAEVIYALEIPDDDPHAASVTGRMSDPRRLLLARYTPSIWSVTNDVDGSQISNAGLLRSALLKRLESSPASLASTLGVLTKAHEGFLSGLAKGQVLIGGALRDWVNSESDDLDAIVDALDVENAHQAQPVTGYKLDELRGAVQRDLDLIRSLKALAEVAAHAAEPKAERLIEELARIAVEAEAMSSDGIPSGDRRKVIVFSTYADTIRDLYYRVKEALDAAPEGSPLSAYRDRLGPPVIGEFLSGKTGGVDQASRANYVAWFAPRTAGRLDVDGNPVQEDKYDILLTTDVLAEGVNLQQAGRIINYDLPWNPMRIVQRHGRVDRIGSQHPKINLGLFFPDGMLDTFLGLEVALNRKLKQADAAVGAGKVLPGVDPYPPRDIYDPDDLVEIIEEQLEERGGSAAGSAEEYRRKLFKAFDADAVLRATVKSLPYGAGSGFAHPKLDHNAFVFCIRVDGAESAWMRKVRVGPDWQPLDSSESAADLRETLLALVAADPGAPECARLLTDQMYSAAFDAWQLAQDDVYEQWMELTDPNNLASEPTAAFREAGALVGKEASFLGVEEQARLFQRLKTVVSTTSAVTRAIRAVLREDKLKSTERIERISAVLDDYGIQPVPPRTALPKVEKSQVRLVAWMAVQGSPT